MSTGPSNHSVSGNGPRLDLDARHSSNALRTDSIVGSAPIRLPISCYWQHLVYKVGLAQITHAYRKDTIL